MANKQINNKKVKFIDYCCCSVTKWCPTLCDPMDCSMPGFPVHHRLPELAQLMSVESVMPSNHLILCCPPEECPTHQSQKREFYTFLIGYYNKSKECLKVVKILLDPLSSLVAQLIKNLPAKQETWVRSLGWKIPWRRERLLTPVFWPREFCQGPAPVGSRDSLRRTASATERNRERDKERILQLRKQRREKRLIFLGLCRKPKNPQHGTCSVHVGRRHPLEQLKVPHLRHLLKWVLEAQAGK